MTASNNHDDQPQIRFISPAKLSQIAQNFLEEHGAAEQFPVPIEEIIELRLRISVIPVPHLKSDRGIDAYISQDFRHITIDDDCYTSYPSRARFSLAHELAHFILHRDAYPKVPVANREDYLAYQKSMTDETLKKIEQQAYILAGCILVPSNKFRAIIDKSISELGRVDQITIQDTAKILAGLTLFFSVSGEVISRRLKAEYPQLFEIMFP
jgi:hypothetical protein